MAILLQVDDSTLTAVAEVAGGAADPQLCTRLVFLATADAAASRSTSHLLDDVDQVVVRRGAEHRVERADRVLTLVCPDPRMSEDHGKLVRSGAHWILEDLESKNGCSVDGMRVERARLGDGAVVQLGHSFFLFRQSRVTRVPAHLAGDVDGAHLPAWPAAMATFSPDLARELEAVVRFAVSPISLVLCGETGTGKEMIARAVHALSGLTGAFVAVNCGALPETLAGAELFGHRRGAFTGATADRPGLARAADGGTLFLDEIGELTPALQALLLRMLQQREVHPIGADQPIAVNLRVIAATLRNLETAIADGQFREDLYARLVGHVLTLPPLRHRREDLGLLISTFLPPHVQGITAPALRALLRYSWPRNIRELEHALETAVALATGDVIDLEHLPERIRGPSPGATAAPAVDPAAQPAAPAADPAPAADAAPRVLGDQERALRDRLIKLFETHDGNVLQVANSVGKRRQQVYKWIDRFAIDLEAYRRKR